MLSNCTVMSRDSSKLLLAAAQICSDALTSCSICFRSESRDPIFECNIAISRPDQVGFGKKTELSCFNAPLPLWRNDRRAVRNAGRGAVTLRFPGTSVQPSMRQIEGPSSWGLRPALVHFPQFLTFNCVERSPLFTAMVIKILSR
jgi:hypothetical protein